MAPHRPRLDGRRFRSSSHSTGHVCNYLWIWTSVCEAKEWRHTIYRMIFITRSIYRRMQNNFALKRRNLLLLLLLLLLTNAFIIKSTFPLDSINNVLIFIAIPVAELWWGRLVCNFIGPCFDLSTKSPQQAKLEYRMRVIMQITWNYSSCGDIWDLIFTLFVWQIKCSGLE
jgi:hypothetical protein